jgi:hypothetical protein
MIQPSTNTATGLEQRALGVVEQADAPLAAVLLRGRSDRGPDAAPLGAGSVVPKSAWPRRSRLRAVKGRQDR